MAIEDAYQETHLARERLRRQIAEVRITALEQALERTAMHFHISHTGSAFLTIPPFSTCEHPVCEAARKLLEKK